MAEKTLDTFCPYCDIEVTATLETKRSHIEVDNETITYLETSAICPNCNKAIGDARVEKKNLERILSMKRMHDAPKQIRFSPFGANPPKLIAKALSEIPEPEMLISSNGLVTGLEPTLGEKPRLDILKACHDDMVLLGDQTETEMAFKLYEIIETLETHYKEEQCETEQK